MILGLLILQEAVAVSVRDAAVAELEAQLLAHQQEVLMAKTTVRLTLLIHC